MEDAKPKKTGEMIINPVLANYILLDQISRRLGNTLDVQNKLLGVNTENQALVNSLLQELKNQVHNTKLEKIVIDSSKYIDGEADHNRYDISDTITTAMAEDPDSPDSPNYNRERIFEVLERNAPELQVLNDGDDSLYVRISHGGSTKSSHEAIIRAGESKIYDNVYELRLRSPTVDLPYRVTEYEIVKGVSISSLPNQDAFTTQSSRNINATPAFTQLPDITVPDGYALVIRADVHNTNDVYVANSGANTNIAANRNTLDSGDNIRLFVTNANLVFVAGSAANQSVDIVVEQ